jgi:CHAT domain-containing protein/tetratricopeptide (TPR) repeat protein
VKSGRIVLAVVLSVVLLAAAPATAADEAALRAQVATFARTQPATVELAKALGALAAELDRQGRYTEAEPLYRRAQQVARAFIARRGRETGHDKAFAEAMHAGLDAIDEGLAANLRKQGRDREAYEMQRTTAIFRFGEDVEPGTHPKRKQVEAEEPAAFRGVGSIPGVAPYSYPSQPAAFRAPTADEQREADDAVQAAAAADAAGNPADAEARYRQVLALDEKTWGPAHYETGSTLTALAGALLAQHRYSEAEAVAQRAVAIQEAALGTHHETAFALDVLAEALEGLGRPADATPLRERVYAIFNQAPGPGQPATLAARMRLGVNAWLRGDLPHSEDLFRKAGEGWIDRLGPVAPEALEAEEDLAVVLAREGRPGEAAHAYRAACAGHAERLAEAARGERAQRGAGPGSDEAADCAARLVRTLWDWAGAGGGTGTSDRPDALRDEAFAAAQISLQSAAGDALARSAAKIAAASEGIGPAAQHFEEAVAEREQVERALAAPQAGKPPDADAQTALAARKQALDTGIARLAGEIATRDPLYWDLRSPRPVGVAALRGTGGEAPLLQPGEALLLFLTPPGQSRGFVFAVTREKAAWARIGMDGDTLRRQVETLRKAIDPGAYGLPDRKSDEGRPFPRASAYALYQALLADSAVQDAIRDKPVLLWVPSGPLTSLPPGLLVTAPPQGADTDQTQLRATKWLLREKAIALLPSVSSLRVLRRLQSHRRPAPDPLLAFADPDFGAGIAAPAGSRGVPRSFRAYYRDGRPLAEALRTLPPLPQTKIEGEALVHALGAGPEALLTGPAASKAALMARNSDGRLGRVRVLEFATHGLVAGDAGSMAEPALALAAGARPDDMLLGASDAATLKLHADWVLLSACNTASPDGPEAEGLSGLSRAFFYAGARALLVSHWSVADAVAARLVPAVLLAQRADPSVSNAEAVRRASLAVLDDKSIDAADPFYWAPFTLVGDPGR